MYLVNQRRSFTQAAALLLTLSFAFVFPHRTYAQYERKNVRFGVVCELPINSNTVESTNYDLEAFNTAYGNFCVKAFHLKDFYGKDKQIMQWAAQYSRNRKMWKNLDTTAKLILQQLTVLDDLNPVHSVNTSYKMVGKRHVYSITFKKSTAGGTYIGECIGTIIPDKLLYIKAIHYIPQENFDEEVQKIELHFFESLKMR